MTKTKRISVSLEDLEKYPKIKGLFTVSPEMSGEFLTEMVERLWSGNKKQALEMIEAFLNKGGKLD